jgi:DNA-binding MarR family transcriptional regulator
MTTKPANARSTSERSRPVDALAEPNRVETLLEFFYPIHYRLLMTLEDVLRRDRVSRKQTAILWLLRCEGGAAGELPRKEIERLLTEWFEVTSSAIAKSLRVLSEPPLQFVKVIPNAESGREKIVVLTPRGREFLEEMMSAGVDFVAELVRPFSAANVGGGIEFLASVTRRLDDLHIRRPARSFRSPRRTETKTGRNR